MRKLLALLLLLASCSPAPKPITSVKQDIAGDDRVKWLMLAPLIKKHFKTDMPVEWIAAELAYQHYLLTIEKEN